MLHLRAVLLLLLLSTKKTTSGFSGNFRTRQTPLLLLHAGITRNSSGISFVSSKLNNIVNHHEEITINGSTMEQEGYTEVVAIPPTLLSVAAAVALVGGASSIMAIMPLPAYAAAASATTAAAMPIPSALWAYGHYVSIIAIFGCLSVERTLVKADMTVDDENTVVKLDVVYGVMAALLYVNHFVCLFVCLPWSLCCVSCLSVILSLLTRHPCAVTYSNSLSYRIISGLFRATDVSTKMPMEMKSYVNALDTDNH
jgi:hypothetical protein